MPIASIEERRRYQREWVARRRREWLDQNGPCVRCGSAEDLQVDHIDPASKVSHRIWTWSTARRLAELAKCQVLCGPCHRAKTAAEQSIDVPHGTHSGYSYHGCRCDRCRAGHATYEAERRRR